MNSKMKAKVITKVSDFNGAVKETDLAIKEETLPEVHDGEFLCGAICLSVDPYMRLFGNTLPQDAVMMGEQVAEVLVSRHEQFPVGAKVAINCGWRTHTVSGGNDVRLLADTSGLPDSLALGVLGMPGGTAYFGLLEVCEPKEGDVLFVNGAAGAVGSVVGQLAKVKGCKVIGCAGTEEKLEYLSDLGFDHVFNYKTRDVEEALKEYAPEGLDIFFDNIGGTYSARVYSHMKYRGRVAVCGTLAGYNDLGGPGRELAGPLPYHHILMKELKVQGFTFFSYKDRRLEAETVLLDLIKQGKLRFRENVVKGFENMPRAFLDVMAGKSMGKTVVYV